MFIQKVNKDITIRQLKVSEATALFHMTDGSRDYLRQWLPWVNQVETIDDSLEFIKEAFERYANRESLDCGLFYKDQLIGMISMNYFDWTNKIGEIGYWLDIDYQGKGLMTLAVHALIERAFNDFELNKIEIHTASENSPSQAIPERLNFKKEGIIRDAEWLYDRHVDHFIYGLLKREWQNNEDAIQ